MRQLILGIDIGGTNIKFGLVNHSGRIIDRTLLSTRSFIQNKDKLIEALVCSCREFMARNRLRRKDLLGIGIGLPGLINIQKGVVNSLMNIPGWRCVPLKRILEKKLGLPTFIDNDVNLMTLGEWKFGAGRGFKNLVCLTLGTGVGGGLVINNEIYRGEGFTAGELGHIPLNEEGPKCNCGGYGCLERYIGNRPLLKEAQKAFKDRNISLEKISDLAARGDKRAVIFWQETAVHLGNGLAGVVNLLNPRLIIIGGGVSAAYAFLFRKLRETIKKRAMSMPASMVKIVKAHLGNDAGIIGTRALIDHALSPR